MFRKKLRKSLKSKPLASEVCYCCVINKDEMLYFPTEDDLRSYVADYEKRLPIYNVSLFRLDFHSLI